MIDLVKRFFSKSAGEDKAGGDSGDRHDTRVATCALLLEMAHMDGEFSESEKERIVSVMSREYGLSDEHVTELLKAAQQERDESIDLWRFARLINENYAVDEKIRIIELVWKIAYTDGRLDKHEDYLVHKLAQLLRLDHKQLIEAKLRVTRRNE